jgi:hypothetical protein
VAESLGHIAGAEAVRAVASAIGRSISLGFDGFEACSSGWESVRPRRSGVHTALTRAGEWRRPFRSNTPIYGTAIENARSGS